MKEVFVYPVAKGASINPRCTTTQHGPSASIHRNVMTPYPVSTRKHCVRELQTLFTVAANTCTSYFLAGDSCNLRPPNRSKDPAGHLRAAGEGTLSTDNAVGGIYERWRGTMAPQRTSHLAQLFCIWARPRQWEWSCFLESGRMGHDP